MVDFMALKKKIVYLLFLVIILPLVGALIISFFNSDIDNENFRNRPNDLKVKILKKKEQNIKNIALSTSVFTFLISIIIWILFDSSTKEFQFVFEFNKLDFFHFNIGLDGISLFFVLLTTFITPIALLSNNDNLLNINYKKIFNLKLPLIVEAPVAPLAIGNSNKNSEIENMLHLGHEKLSNKEKRDNENKKLTTSINMAKKNILELKYFLISFLILESLQILTFVVLDLLLFYIFFESVLPVLFIIILLYGSGEEKVRSAFLLFLYTLAGSLFMLLSILIIYSFVGSTDFQLISLSEISLNSQKLLWLSYHLSNDNLTSRYLIS
jgi:NADH:ubiquinone oxidoreductase subunit 4 (subunit M)